MKTELIAPEGRLQFKSMTECANYLGKSQSYINSLFKGKESTIHWRDYTIIRLSKIAQEKDMKEFRSKVKPSSFQCKDWMYKESESLQEKQKKEEWENHCSQCCTKSKDNTTYIPNSLLKEIPELKDYTLPKSMSF